MIVSTPRDRIEIRKVGSAENISDGPSNGQDSSNQCRFSEIQHQITGENSANPARKHCYNEIGVTDSGSGVINLIDGTQETHGTLESNLSDHQLHSVLVTSIH